MCLRFIYTGSVEVNLDIAQDLLRAADQYLLDGLKHLCEYAIAQVGYGISLVTAFSFSVLPVCLMPSHYLLQDICVENVSLMYELSEAFNAMSLRKACILFILEQFDKLSAKPWYAISV